MAGLAAITGDDRTVGERGRGAGQESDDLGYLLGTAPPSQRHRLSHRIVIGIGPQRRGERGLHRARRYSVDSYPVRTEVFGRRQSKSDDSELRCAVGDAPRESREASDRREVHDRATAPFKHRGKHGMDAVERTVEIRAEIPTPLLGRDLCHAGQLAAAGAVDEDVGWPGLLDRSPYRPLD